MEPLDAGKNWVHMDVIEQSKENIEPRKAGHSASALAKSSSRNHTEKEVAGLQKERMGHERKIETSESLDDPLQVWIDYIKWTLDNFPQGETKTSGLVTLLERCTREFVRNPLYKDDVRYLRIWMQYVNYIDEPVELFSFLAHHHIGQESSIFYEEYANYFESRGLFQKADEVYQKGKRMKAKPFLRFQQKYQQFTHRWLEFAPQSFSSNTNSVNPLQTTFESTNIQEISQSRTQISKPKFKFSVYSDADGSGKDGQPGTWQTLGTVDQRRKENNISATSWVGEKLPLKSSRKLDPLGKFQVHCDEEVSKE